MKKVLSIILMALAVTFVFVSCENKASHEHSYGDEWKYDATNHWHECTCGAKDEEAAHSYEVVNDGEKLVKKCTVCGYVSSDAVTGTLVTTAEALKTALSGDATTIYLGSDVTSADAITVTKAITIDLNGKKLSFVDGKNLAIQPTSTTTSIDVIIKNGSIDGGSGNASVIKVYSYVNLTLDDVDMTANKAGNDNALVFLAIGANPAKLTIQNGCNLTMTGDYGVGTNATTNANLEINIKDSTITATGGKSDTVDGRSCGLMVNVSSKVTIENSTISGEQVGVLLRGAGNGSDNSYKTVIKNSTIKATGKYAYSDLASWGSGIAVPAAALVIGNANGNYHRPTTVELDNVALEIPTETYNGKHIWVVQENESYLVKVTGTIAGETLTHNDNANSATVNLTKTDGKSVLWNNPETT